MATTDVNRIVQVPGRLAINPSSFTVPFPGNGTALGAARSILCLPQIVQKEVPLDPYGPEPGEVIYIGSRWKIVAICRGYDPDAIATVFPNVQVAPAGRASSSKAIVHPGTNAPGSKRSGSAVELVFWPDDQLEHPAAVFFRAIPIVDPSTEIWLTRGKQWEFTAAFLAIRRVSDGNAAAVGLLEVLTP